MQPETTLTQAEIVQAATNDPQTAEVKVTLGDKEFAILDLPYDDYIQFLSYLQPIVEIFTSKLANKETMSSQMLFKYCSASLPQMATIVCRQTEPNITIKEVKKLGKTPFNLAKLVLAQIDKNKMIQDIASFFEQILPYLTIASRTQQSTTEETPSS